MKERIELLIKDYVEEYQKNEEIMTSWREPLIKFADAGDKIFYKFKEVVRPSHALPKDFLSSAETVIAFFLPFSREIANSNIEGKYSSKEWAIAYIETNQLISELNSYIKDELKKLNYQSSIIPATHNFDEEELKSDWSHRHAAYAAGLGSFGINNMLISEKGCAGRYGSIVTDLKIEASERKEEEKCLNKAGYDCRRCVERCVNNSLQIDSFDRFKCYELLLENVELHSEIGLTDVCGKCCVDLPCSFTDPTA